MKEIQNSNTFTESPITYYTHLTNEIVVGNTCVYIDGRCVFRVREPNDSVRGLRSSIGICDHTVTKKEIEQNIRPKCGKVFIDEIKN